MIINLALRAFQVIFSVIILGLSIALVHGQIHNLKTNEGDVRGGAPSQTEYTAFVGAASLVVALLGIGALFVERLQGLIIMAADGLITLLTLAGGIALAVSLRGGSCSDSVYLRTNDIVRGAGTIDGVVVYNPFANLTTRCHEAQAVMVFLFLSFLAFGATGVLGAMHKTGRSRSIV